ncbi:unnamed protein product [Litomosoides sigmodontis]|uniref:Btz domain-containing protein n=1 Tax=Litomosoides sigmodontis TaxID=42156 RepID=A0A3P6UB06_LITSI|nr:unnamed protein product [Litomosoides sigmodontis]
MGSGSRSSAVSRGEKSRRSLGDSSSSRQERLRYKRSSGRGNTPTKTATNSSKVVPPKRTIHRSSPFRKSKPLPVNELDILALSQKEQQSKSGNKGKDGIQNHPERTQNRQFAGVMDRRRFWSSRNNGFGMRQGMDYRRTPMYPLRRGIGGSDMADPRTHIGRNGRQSYQRTAEQNKSTNDEEKPVMNLFDPCKVPTGRSYFTHDDRATKPARTSRSRYSISGDSGWQSLPVGWRNVRKVRRSDDVLNDDNYALHHKKRSERNPTDEVWKHDMFECEGSEEAQVVNVQL